jgi:hypothetical protein
MLRLEKTEDRHLTIARVDLICRRLERGWSETDGLQTGQGAGRKFLFSELTLLRL